MQLFISPTPGVKTPGYAKAGNPLKGLKSASTSPFSGLALILAEGFNLRLCLFALLTVTLLAACEAAPTPFPVDVPPTPTPTALPGDLPPLRYALAPPFTERGFSDLAQLREAGVDVYALVDPPAASDLGSAYDVVAAYGAADGEWTASALLSHIALVVDSTRTPFDDPTLRALLLQSVDSAPLRDRLNLTGVETLPNPENAPSPNAIRTQMANDGLPDGVALVLAEAFVPGADTLSAQMYAAGFDAALITLSVSDIRSAFDDGRIQAALVVWTLDAEREAWIAQFGADSFRDLFTIPIRYRALPDLKIAFTPGGWPLPTR